MSEDGTERKDTQHRDGLAIVSSLATELMRSSELYVLHLTGISIIKLTRIAGK